VKGSNLVSQANRGDQIGRTFAHWAIATLGNFSEMTEVARMFVLPTFPYGSSCAFILTKMGLGIILDNIFKNSSGHPEANFNITHVLIRKKCHQR
jgi:hypothetical protein